MTTKPDHGALLLLTLLCSCTQPAAQPAPATTRSEPRAVSDRDDPFKVKMLIEPDDPSRISDPVTVGDKTYSLEDYSELARLSMRDRKIDHKLFEISINTNIYGRISDRNYIRDKSFTREDIKNIPISINIDFLPQGHFYRCPAGGSTAYLSYKINKMFFTCARADGELWIGFEADTSIGSEYKVEPKINRFIESSIKNTKIWNECHPLSEESVAPRSIYRSYEEQKCMEEKGIHKTYLHVFYKASKITTYRIFIMEPFTPNPQPGEKHGWRIIGHLPYELDYDPN